MAAAMRRMEDKLGEALALPPGSRVLDAGCGEGDVAIRLRTRFGLEVDGVDLLRPNLRRARAKAARLGLAGSLRFHRLDYGDLPFGDRSFDGAYTMETLVHAFDHRQALRELGRVLKPGGALALFEYSVPPRSQMTPEQREAFDFVVERSAMRSLPAFVHGGFPAILDGPGSRSWASRTSPSGSGRCSGGWRAHLLPAGRGGSAAGRPGGAARLHGPGRGLPPPGGLALQRRPRPTRWGRLTAARGWDDPCRALVCPGDVSRETSAGRRPRGNPVRIRSCPAAVSGNDRRHRGAHARLGPALSQTVPGSDGQ